MGYSKNANPCPRNLKSTKVDVTFSVFIISSMKTVGPSGCMAPDHEVWRLDNLEEMVCGGMGGRNPQISIMPK
jgi:hypothetical protein